MLTARDLSGLLNTLSKRANVFGTHVNGLPEDGMSAGDLAEAYVKVDKLVNGLGKVAEALDVDLREGA